jgi:hypothetical protein
MQEKERGVLGHPNLDSHENRQRVIREADAAARKGGRLETHEDIAEFVGYVTRNREDYLGRPASFYWPELGVDFDQVEKNVVQLSNQPENSGKVLYVALNDELWAVSNGEVTKKVLPSDIR